MVIQVHDRMTECVYPSKLESFKNDVVPEPVIQIPVIEVSVRPSLNILNFWCISILYFDVGGACFASFVLLCH